MVLPVSWFPEDDPEEDVTGLPELESSKLVELVSPMVTEISAVPVSENVDSAVVVSVVVAPAVDKSLELEVPTVTMEVATELSAFVAVRRSNHGLSEQEVSPKIRGRRGRMKGLFQ